VEALLCQGFSALKFFAPLVCTKKSEQIIRIYAGFYQFIGALIEYCLFHGLIVTKSRPGVQSGSISVFRCLFDYVY